jgi:Fe-S-cluster-containing dehydrogenase component
MTETEDRTAGGGGDIYTEIREGKLSRRNFLMATGFAGLGVFGGVRALGTLTGKTPIIADAKGVLFHDPNRCVGCRRCELACVEFNDGKANAYLSRVKIARNLNYGPAGASRQLVENGDAGKWGSIRIIAETCKQCPHPVPCAEACPKGAIKAHPVTGARKIDTTLCIGCGICTTACPWAMPTIDAKTGKSTKCFLCDGRPECARACPTGALKYVAWRDLRLLTPVIQSGIMPAGTTTNCSTCHG